MQIKLIPPSYLSIIGDPSYLQLILVTMEYKAKYRTKNKKLNHKVITDYKTLRSAIKKAFPDAPLDCIVSYFEDDQYLDVENDDDFQLMTDSPKKMKLFIRHQGEDCLVLMDASIVQSKVGTVLNESWREERQILEEMQHRMSKGESQKEEAIGQAVSERQATVAAKIVEQGKEEGEEGEEGEAGEEEAIEQPIKEKIANPMSNVKPQNHTEKENPKTQTPEPKMEEPEGQVNQYTHKGVKCSFCSYPEIQGSRWKCLSCFDYDLCSKCYLQSKHKSGKDHKNKSHDFIEIADETFWSRVNFAHSIRRLFNPSYEVNQNDRVIGEWISENDIAYSNLNFVKEVWKQSAEVSRKVMAEFDRWHHQQYGAETA